MNQETGLTKQEPQSLVQSAQRPAITPACDIYESDDEVLLVADMPGVDAGALKINIDKGELTLEANRPLSSQGTYLEAEVRDCDFRRRFMLPSGIDASKINAELTNGVLRLHLPKSESLKARQISVKAG